MSYSRFVQIHTPFHPESGTRQEWDKLHQLRNAINHLKKQPSIHLFQGRKCPSMRVVFQANPIIIRSDNITIATRKV